MERVELFRHFCVLAVCNSWWAFATHPTILNSKAEETISPLLILPIIISIVVIGLFITWVCEGR